MLHIAQHKSKISLPKIAFPEALPQKILLFKRSLQKILLKTLLYSLFLPGGNVFSNFFIEPPLQPLLSHTSSPFLNPRSPLQPLPPPPFKLRLHLQSSLGLHSITHAFASTPALPRPQLKTLPQPSLQPIPVGLGETVFRIIIDLEPDPSRKI